MIELRGGEITSENASCHDSANDNHRSEQSVARKQQNSITFLQTIGL
jgi:hypothetical protein